MANTPFVGLNGIQPAHRPKTVEEYSYDQLASRSTASSLDMDDDDYIIEWEFLPDKALGIILSHLEPCELTTVRETCGPWCNFVDKNLLTVRPKAWPGAPPLDKIFPSLTRLDLTEMSSNKQCVMDALRSAMNLSVLKRLDLVVEPEEGECRLPSEVALLTKLRIIVASAKDGGSECVKMSLPEEVSSLCSLEEIRFKYSVPDFCALQSISSLKFLRLGKRNFGCLDDLDLMTNLQGLDLVQDRHLTAIPPEICSILGLRRLDLSRNMLIELPEALGCLSHLTVLVANRNCIAHIPDSISQLKQLVHLDLTNNVLAGLPASMLRLKSLRLLDLSGNQLEGLPDDPGDLTSLRTLILDFNDIKKLGAGIGKMVRLRHLSLQHNHLEELSGGIGNLVDLTHLYLSANHLVSIPASISRMESLCHVSLDQNCLEVLPKSMSRLERLSSIDISFNRFQAMPLPKSVVDNLKEMYVEYNPFSVASEGVPT
ncbi:hypothetical protein BSKO_11229 [Bryopsis sp. KO-2023]|nr:hypothetical protein BSKO_11229 [Bryopsis sp. KO-2023]